MTQAQTTRASAGDEKAGDAGSAMQYLTFVLRGEQYALGILSIKEIIEYGELTTVPMMPASIRGVINLRGAVVPVLDLCARFGQPSSPTTKRTCIVIVETRVDGEKQDIGVIVDSVNEVLEIPASQIEPAPAFGSGIRAEFISGMGKVNGRFVILLDADRVLSASDLTAAVALAGEGAADRALAA
jgi:purine-binding chemotaxis protein CheW